MDQLIKVNIANQDNLINLLVKTMEGGSLNDLSLDMVAFSILKYLNFKD